MAGGFGADVDPVYASVSPGCIAITGLKLTVRRSMSDCVEPGPVVPKDTGIMPVGNYGRDRHLRHWPALVLLTMRIS